MNQSGLATSEQLTESKTFGALKEDLNNSSASCDPSWLNLFIAFERSSQRSAQAWSSTGPWNSGAPRRVASLGTALYNNNNNNDKQICIAP